MNKRAIMFVAAMAVALTGCEGERVTALEARMTTLETEHTRTREKLQALLVWVNKRQPPDAGLVDWIDAVHAKVFPSGNPTDPVKPSNPPEPF